MKNSLLGFQLYQKWQVMYEDSNNWRNLWQECADWSQPTKDNILRLRLQGQEKSPQRIIDTCIEANNNFASGNYANLFPPNISWVRFKSKGSRINVNEEEVRWYETISREILDYLRGSNFDQEINECLLDLGCFGTICMYIEQGETVDDPVFFRSFSVGTIKIAINNRGVVDTVARKISMTPRQAIQEFGEEALLEQDLGFIIEQARHGQNSSVDNASHEFIHMVCPRSDRDVESKTSDNLPFGSYYIYEKTKAIVKESGYDYMPYFIGRWKVGNEEVYGRSPMMDCLATTRSMNVMERNVLLGSELRVGPQWLLPDDGSVRNISNRPNAKIYYRANNPNSKPERLPPASDVGVGMDILEWKEGSIYKFFFNHLFRPLENSNSRMTAWEAMERTKTDMMILSPMISRLQDEFVSPMLQYVFYILQQAGALTPPPESLESADFEIEYVTRLAQSTKSMEVQGTIEVIRQLGELGQIAPQLMQGLDYIDPDKLTLEMWYGSSASMSVLKDSQIVAAEREMRAQQAQQQQMIDNMAPVADSMQKVSGKVDPESILATIGEQS